MGFSQAKATEALMKAEGDARLACDLLLKAEDF